MVAGSRPARDSGMHPQNGHHTLHRRNVSRATSLLDLLLTPSCRPLLQKGLAATPARTARRWFTVRAGPSRDGARAAGFASAVLVCGVSPATVCWLRPTVLGGGP